MAKILLVEDSPVMRKLLVQILGGKNYEIVIATDAVSAVATARKEKPDLIILDLGLPGGDGFLLMQRFQNLGTLALVPVIVVSASDSASMKERAFQEGAQAFFPKPPNPEALLAAVQSSLGNTAGGAPAKIQDQ